MPQNPLPIRRIPWPPIDAIEPDAMATREWLVSNGLGGYASGTVAGVITRRYHGILIAALAAPLGRIVMLSHVAEEVRLPGNRHIEIGGRERIGDAPDAHGTGSLVEFRLDAGLPVWRYDVDGVVIEKRLFMPHMQNTVLLLYEVVSGADRAELMLRPSVNFRVQEAPLNEPLGWPYELRVVDEQAEICLARSSVPGLRLKVSGAESTLMVKGQRFESVLYPVEESRGYHARGDLWSPGCFNVELTAGRRAALVASTESIETMSVLTPEQAFDAEMGRRRRLLAMAAPEAREGIGAELVLAADQFIITPAGRSEETARAHAYGDEVRTVIAGYHWFTDWGRDTMISLEGLTLVTGRHVEAAYILRTFAHYVRDGLIPNMFPEGRQEALYHTADATLWFFHAIARYVRATGDHLTLAALYPALKDIIAHHLRGTRFGIHVDDDGLLTQGAPGYQLTWMDAKVDDWVVTPRRGKAVEINALWYNALKLMEEWANDQDDEPSAYREHAARARDAFNQRFWFPEGRYLYDVVDAEASDGGRVYDDTKCRPNQVLAISLDHPVLDQSRWQPVMHAVYDRLVTPVGLRSLAPDDPDFKSRYFGDLRSRDAAYHQGTVWAWLVGPFVDAWLKVHPDDVSGVHRALDGLVPHMDEACIGSISEVFDATQPFTPRGCIAQAWSVAEALRAWVKLGSVSRQQDSSSRMALSLPQ
jgi:predicted glycogen debranching enzyme